MFAATLAKAVDIEAHSPGALYLTLATDLERTALDPGAELLPPSATRRVLVVLTDEESQPLEPRLARSFDRRPGIETVFVRFWDADERIYETGVAEGGYEPDPRSEASLGRAASS